ncbi:MAG TPA: hemerythrin domain-containing protein [Azospira sp.]|nr:hemerythrin domain-containing protein [Azospira sp.]
MKRHPALLQLSREHHTALKLSLDCRKGAQSGDAAALAALCLRVRTLFAAELDPHFRTEEEEVLPWLEAAGEKALVARTLADHGQLRSLAERIGRGDTTALDAFATALNEHVRFEERELFERAQTYPAFTVA